MSLSTLPFRAFRNTYNFLAATPLRKVPGMLKLSNIIFRSVWAGGNVINVQGNKMYININDPSQALRNTFQAYAMNLIHEETTTKLFKKIVRKGDVVLDIGANIGYFSLLAGQAVGDTGKVVCVEPEPRNFEYLKKNIEINGFKWVKPHRKAVSNRGGKTQLYICTYDSGHHTINQFEGIGAISRGRSFRKEIVDIDTIRVDDLVAEESLERVNIIKMDVEGAEALALEGMRETLTRNDVTVFLEFFPILLKKMGSDPRKYIDNLLQDFGFTVYAIGHDYDLGNALEDLIVIKSYNELSSMLQEEGAHVNLLLTKRPIGTLLA